MSSTSEQADSTRAYLAHIKRHSKFTRHGLGDIDANLRRDFGRSVVRWREVA